MDFLTPDTTSNDVKSMRPVAALLPIGSYEQHGPFLPLTTDTLIACAISRELAAKYALQVLSPVTISCSHEHSAWPGTVSISSRTLLAVVADIRDSLRRSGVHKLVLVNAHGGNYALRNAVQESTIEAPSMALYPGSADWATARTHAGMTTNDHDDMHAGELETSILLHVCPEVVRDGYQTADHLVGDRQALLTLGMTAYTKSGVLGRPSLASAAKGKAALSSLTASFAECLASLVVVDADK